MFSFELSQFFHNPKFRISIVFLGTSFKLWLHTKISEKFFKILEEYQNIRKLKNIESTKISENWILKYQNLRKIMGTTIIDNSLLYCTKWNFNALLIRTRWFRWLFQILKFLKFSEIFWYIDITGFFWDFGTHFLTFWYWAIFLRFWYSQNEKI